MSREELQPSVIEMPRAAEELYSQPYDDMSLVELSRVRRMAFRRGEAWKIDEIGLEAGKRYNELMQRARELEEALTYLNVTGDCSANIARLKARGEIR